MSVAVKSAEGIPWLSKAGLAKLPMFTILVVSCTVVHLNFERVFWLTDGADIFGKYAQAPAEALAPDPAEAAMAVAKQVYFTKATWMIVQAWMLLAGWSVPAAMSWSFVLYAAELVAFFPLRTYIGLNALLAVGLVIEQVVEQGRRKRHAHRS